MKRSAWVIRTPARETPGYEPWKYWNESAADWTWNVNQATTYEYQWQAQLISRCMRVGADPFLATVTIPTTHPEHQRATVGKRRMERGPK